MPYLGSTPARGLVGTANIDDDAVTLAKLAGGTDGQVITYDASGNPSVVGPGTDGQVLTSTGAGSPPAFEAVPVTSPAISFVSSTTITSSTASVEFTGLDNSCDCYIVRWTNLHVSAYGNVAIRTSDDASSHSYESGASDYSWVYSGGYPIGTFTSQQHWDSADTMIKCGHDPVYIAAGTTDTSSGICYIWNPSDTTYQKIISGTSWNARDYGGTDYSTFANFHGVRRSASAVTAVQFFHSLGGTFDTAKFCLYKWSHS